MEVTQHLKLRKACTRCRHLHLACVGLGQPCQRCVRSGQADRCVFLPSRKRGRPFKTVVADEVGSSAMQDSVGESMPYAMTAHRHQQGAEQPHMLAPTHTDAQEPWLAHGWLPMHPGRVEGMLPDVSQEKSISRRSDGMSNDHRLLDLLLQQMQDLRKENEQLRNSMSKMDSRYKKHKRYTRALELDLWRLLLPLSGQFQARSLRERLAPDPFFLSPISKTSVPAPALTSHLIELRQQIPFLGEYDVLPGSIAVDDLKKPFAAYACEQFNMSDEWPIFIFASSAYCSLLGYDFAELVGRDIEFVCYENDQSSCESMSLYAQIGPMTHQMIGSIFTVDSTLVAKDGSFIYTQSRYQLFFTKLGRVKWILHSIDKVKKAEGNNIHSRAHALSPSPSSSPSWSSPMQEWSAALSSPSMPRQSEYDEEEWATFGSGDDPQVDHYQHASQEIDLEEWLMTNS